MISDQESESIQDTVRSFLQSKSGFDIMDDNVDLVKSGVINSFLMLEFIGFIEKIFDVNIDLESLHPETFNSISNIVSHINIWKDQK